MGKTEFLDALVVGAGFSGLHILWKLRKLGFSVKIYERENGLGGTWWCNRYPGARVDSETPIYQLTEEEEVWKSFEWRERFPGREELQRYFRHVDKMLDLSKDIILNTSITSAQFDGNNNIWLVKTDKGEEIKSRHLITCTGFASKKYTPSFKGLDTFRGQWYHSGVWPENGVDLAGKRVAIVGTGASGVQIIQEIGNRVGHLTVYQRTPNLCLPMRQVFFNDVQDKLSWKFPSKERYNEIFTQLKSTFGALMIDLDFTTKKFYDSTTAERRALYEFLWNYGGFSFWLGGYMECFFEEDANDEVYAFWAEHTRARIHDTHKRDLLAPIKKPHAFGTKRPCLETAYYEVFNQPNVDIINVRESPILEITAEGIKTEKEGVIPVDIIILATGFDSVTGGILDIDIRNAQGVTLKEKWSKGVKTYLGLSSHGFPNLFWFYGPQAPTAFSNGPTTGGIQGDWAAELLVKMRRDGNTIVDATEEGEEEWTKEVMDLWYKSLFPASDSWYQGANIPGKKREPLNCFCGIPTYIKKIKESQENNYKGFNIA